MHDATRQESGAPAGCLGCNVDRRRFVQTALLMAAGVALAQACGGGGDAGVGPTVPGGGSTGGGSLPAGVSLAGNTLTVDLAQATALTGSPGFVVITQTPTPILIVAANATYVAYDARCPHAQSTNFWAYNPPNMTCNNHGSTFVAATGALVLGPATSGLVSRAVQRAGNILTINAG